MESILPRPEQRKGLSSDCPVPTVESAEEKRDDDSRVDAKRRIGNIIFALEQQLTCHLIGALTVHPKTVVSLLVGPENDMVIARQGSNKLDTHNLSP